MWAVNQSIPQRRNGERLSVNKGWTALKWIHKEVAEPPHFVGPGDHRMILLHFVAPELGDSYS